MDKWTVVNMIVQFTFMALFHLFLRMESDRII